MSKLEEIRAVLQRQRHAIITESNVTVFPYQPPSKFDPYGRTWTHAVTFGIIPRMEIEGDGQLNRFMDGIADACKMPRGAVFYRGFGRHGYGRAQYWENIGTAVERHPTTITINDSQVPLTDEFRDGFWVKTSQPVQHTLVRQITLSFSPYGSLGMMVLSVGDGNSVWMHEPTAEQLEPVLARQRRW